MCTVMLGAAGARASDSAGLAGDARDFVAMTEFVAGAPLTPADRDRVVAETRSQLATQPAAVRHADEEVKHFLTVMVDAPDWKRAASREAFRFAFEQQPSSEPLRQIVDRLDPVVAFDGAHKRIVTDGTLVAWKNAYAFVAKTLAIPGPPEDFVAGERAKLKAGFAALPDAQQESVAHVERNYQVLLLMLTMLTEPQRGDWIRSSRALAHESRDVAMRLAESMSQTYDVAVSRAVVQKSIVDNGVLNASMQINSMMPMP